MPPAVKLKLSSSAPPTRLTLLKLKVWAPLVSVPETPVRLEEVTGGKRVAVPAQIEKGATPRLWWVLAGTTAAGQTRTFELVAGASPTVPGVHVTKNDKFLQIGQGADNILRYHHAIWHGFVLTGSTFHFFAVLFYVVPDVS